MSSPRKDARWFLATGLAESAGFDMMPDLPYPVVERLLATADEVLSLAPATTVHRLAAKWNETEPNRRTSPPDGWFIFGSHAGTEGLLEFSAEVDPEDGLPLWERHPIVTPQTERLHFTLHDLSRLQGLIYRAFPVVPRYRLGSASEHKAFHEKGLEDRGALIDTLERMINRG